MRRQKPPCILFLSDESIDRISIYECASEKSRIDISNCLPLSQLAQPGNLYGFLKWQIRCVLLVVINSCLRGGQSRDLQLTVPNFEVSKFRFRQREGARGRSREQQGAATEHERAWGEHVAEMGGVGRREVIPKRVTSKLKIGGQKPRDSDDTTPELRLIM